VLIDEPFPEPDLQQLRQQLIAAARDLSGALSRFSNGQMWQEHLQLPAFVEDASLWNEPVSLSEEQIQQLELMVRRYAKTASLPDLHLINQLESFQRVHRELLSFVEKVGTLNLGVGKEQSRPAPDADR
jgi:hypothetical protein